MTVTKSVTDGTQAGGALLFIVALLGWYMLFGTRPIYRLHLNTLTDDGFALSHDGSRDALAEPSSG